MLPCRHSHGSASQTLSGEVIRVHALVQRTARDRMSPDRLDEFARISAEALLDIWPDIDSRVGPLLRANTDALRSHAEGALLHPVIHPVLIRAGRSRRDGGPGDRRHQTLPATHRRFTSER